MKGTHLAALRPERPTRRRLSRLATFGGGVVFAFVGFATPAAQAVPVGHTNASTAPAPAKTVSKSVVPGAGSDVALNGWGDGSGYHLDISSPSNQFNWHEVAVIDPDSISDSGWTGYQCLSGDGRYAAVVTMPTSAANTPSLREHGAFAYTVDLASGAVHPAATGVALEYFSPGCGTADTAVFSVSPIDFASSTELLVTDMATGAVSSSYTVAGQLTSAVPTQAGLVGVEGRSLVRVVAGRKGGAPTVKVASVEGSAYDLRAAADGGVDFLTATGPASASAWHEKAGRALAAGSGSLASLGLFEGRSGHNILVGASSATPGSTRLKVVDGSVVGQPAFASLDGGAVFSYAAKSTASAPAVTTAGGTPRATSAALNNARSDKAVPSYLPAGVSDPVQAVPAGPPAPGPEGGTPPGGASTAGTSTGGVKTATLDSVMLTSAQTPTCAIPRLSNTMQVIQPNAAQVDWATQMDEQGLLTGSSYQRPANYANMGLVAYAPSSDFAPIALSHPSSDNWNSVPRSVMEAIMAQESNWDQASWHALPGISGDPLIADYYGAAGTITKIDYANADCGYGISQVTTGMRSGDYTYSLHGQMKIANDYEENIAAGLQILESTWNQLYAAGITANGGDPRYLENWYFAAWAYNTGIEPNAAHGNNTNCTPGPSCTGPDGTWGLGWANNPADPAYPPNRLPFLKTSYGDAAHPGDWPYQEKIMGWMASPLLWNGVQDYAAPTYNGGSTWIQLPGFMSFCSTTGDDCTPGGSGQSGTCNLSDSYCWWHTPVTWVSTCTTTCATSSYTVGSGSTSPGVTDPHPPTCTVNSSDLPTTSNGPPIIVIDDTENSSGVPLNVVGCNSAITSGGTFSIAYGSDASGNPIGAIDTHQLGAGFGGHILFTHTELASPADLVNTGTWTPNLPSTQYYTVKVHLPATGAAATDVVYDINPGGSLTPFKIRLNQHQGREAWLTLGTFALEQGATVTLSNVSGMAAGTYDVAFDAVAFLPQGGTPGVPIGGPPSVADAPAGSNPSWMNCPCTYANSGDPVNTGTGAFSQTWTDLSTPGRGAPLGFARTYTSATADPSGPNGSLAVNGPFGYGWTDSYDMYTTTNSTTGAVTVYQEDGSTVVFNDSGGTYTPTEPRDDAALSVSGSQYLFTRTGQHIFKFDTSSGHLLAETDLAGLNASTPYQTTLAYNGSGQLSTVTDPAGRVYTLGWSGGHIVSLSDSAGREVTYGYDAAGDLTDVYGVGTTRSPSLEDNDHATYTYTSAHLMSSFRQPDLYGSNITPTPVTSMTYDSSERVISQTDPDGNTTQFNYGPSSTPSLTAGQTLVTDPVGHQTLYTYSEGLLGSETDGYNSPAAGTWTYYYDPITLGRTVTVDPDGNTTTASYDANGNLLASSNADGFTTSYTYNANNQVTSDTNPLGVQTTYGYDEADHVETASGWNTGTYTWGDLTSETVTQQQQSAEIYNGMSAPAVAAPRTTSYYYDTAAYPGEQTRVVDPATKTTTTAYDSYGDVVSVTDAAGDKTLTGWDTARGWKVSSVSPAGSAGGTTTSCTPPATGCTAYIHDAYGNVTQTTDPLGHTIKAVYDADGKRTSSTDADNNTTTYTYDPAGHLTRTTQPDTTFTQTAYNADGTVHSTTDAGGEVTVYGYDAQGRQVTRTNPDNETTTAGYDPAGNLTSVTTPDTKKTTNTYDPAGQLSAVSYSDGTTPNVTSIVYDPIGHRTSMADGTGTSSWAYDAFGELTQATNGAGQTVSYIYDADGNQMSVVYPAGGTVTNSYDQANRLSSVTDWNHNKTSFGYSPDSALTTTTYPNGTTVTAGYNNGDQMTSTTLADGGTTLGSVAYGRDNAGQLDAQTFSGGLVGTNATYGYTQLQQLQSATSGGTTSTYSYDGSNNPTALAGQKAGYDPASQLCWSTTGTVTGTPTCASPPTGATAYTDNSNGQRTASTPAVGVASAFAWNEAGELTSASTPAGSGAYAYNGDGQRASKTVGGVTTTFTWAETPNGTQAVIGDGTTSYIYGPGNQPIEQTASSGTYYYVADQNGNTIALTGSAGTIAASYSYSPYGQTTGHTGTVTTPFAYGQGYTDAETGLLYLVNRYYDPVSAQFLSVDPALATTHSAYGYVSDNPLNSTDPVGLCGFFCSVGHFTKKHAKVISEVGMVAAGIGLAATGVGMVADIGILTETSLASADTLANVAGVMGWTGEAAGLVATGADAAPCIVDHTVNDCVGAGLGILSMGVGAVPLLAREISDAARVAGDVWTAGVLGATTAWDAGRTLSDWQSEDPPPPPPKGAGGSYGHVSNGGGYSQSQIASTVC